MRRPTNTSDSVDVSCFTTEEEKKEAFLRRFVADLGPVARRVFNPSLGYDGLNSALGIDLTKHGLDKLAHIAKYDRDAGPTSKFQLSHNLLLLVPTSDFTWYSFVPSSVSVGRKILQLVFGNNMDAAKSLMGRSGAHLGLVFEPYAHFVLAKGGTFQIRDLANASTSQLLLEERKTAEVENKDLTTLKLESDKYYIPTDPTFAVINSWTDSDMFQMTVSTSHPIKSTSKQFKALENKGPKRVIFVVPASLEQQFQQQPLVLANGKPAADPGGPKGGWNDVGQFVLGL